MRIGDRGGSVIGGGGHVPQPVVGVNSRRTRAITAVVAASTRNMTTAWIRTACTGANLGQEIAGRGILPRRVRPVATQESPCRDPEALNRSQSWGVTGGDKWGKSGADDTVSDGSLWV